MGCSSFRLDFVKKIDGGGGEATTLAPSLVAPLHQKADGIQKMNYIKVRVS